jgi:Ca-activated chloride channel family protein
MTRLLAKVEVEDGVATTTLRQTVRNDGPRPAEADWVLPLPDGAVADRFSMTMNGVPVAGEVLGADKAREVYESIVRRRRDPGLLEYVGRGCLRARIFPVPPGGEVQVEVGFRQILPEDGGLRRWSFAPRAAGLGGRAPEQLVLDLEVRSRWPIGIAFSPVPGVRVTQDGERVVRASFEGRAADLPGEELAVFYGLREKDFGLDLLTYRAKGNAEGTFLMLVSPKREWDASEVMKKSVTFVVDTSGSMAGGKLEQATGALRFFVETLGADDRFNVVEFSSEAIPFFPAPVAPTPENLAAAHARIERLTARGGTNIDAALESALHGAAPTGRVPIVLFLTDGEATVGVTDTKTILQSVARNNEGRARLFVFGVGDDVNTHLLDELAAQNGGARDYVRAGEDIEQKTGALLTKISHPVLTDLALEVTGVEITRQVPARLPDLFAGGRLAIFGRYVGNGARAVRLTGRVQGERRTYVYEGTFTAEPLERYSFVPSLWAERRVAMLLDALRLNGANRELVDEITRLGREHGIVTPYTSHLVLEESLALGAGGWRGPGDSIAPDAGGGGRRRLGDAGVPAPDTPGTAAGPSTPGFAVVHARDLAVLASELQAAGLLPAEAKQQELEQLAVDVVRELRASDEALRGLGRTAVGGVAVDDSAYLGRLLDSSTVSAGDDFWLGKGEERSKGARLLQLFTRKVRDKTFALRAGVWTDVATLDPRVVEAPTVVEVEAYSTAYFELLRKAPDLAPYLSLSDRMLIELGGVRYRITPPRDLEQD